MWPTLKISSRTKNRIPATEVAPPTHAPDVGDSTLGPAIPSAPLDRPELPPHLAPASDFFHAQAEESHRQIDERWLRDVFQGDAPQLTLRATVTGLLIGCILGVSNVYVGLKIGWATGVALTATLLSVLVWRGSTRFGWTRSELSALETNCMQSTASAAGFSVTAVVVTALPAHLMSGGTPIHAGWLMLWSALLCTLGVLAFLPVKRAMIHYEELPFPSGLAAAQLVRGLYQKGNDLVGQAKALGVSMVVGALLKWQIDVTYPWWPARIPASLSVPGTFAGRPWVEYTVALNLSAVHLAAGALLGVRNTLWMTLGAAVTYVGLAPVMASRGWIDGVDWNSVQFGFALWCGTAIIISTSVVALAEQGATVGRAMLHLWRQLHSGRETGTDPLADIEPPAIWFRLGAPIVAAAVLLVGHTAFGLPWWISTLVVLATLLFATVSARASGETDISPAGPLARVTQLGHGALAADLTGNLMAASITATGAASASDLSVRLKCGYLLGAKTRLQVLAQVIGVVAGSVTVVGAFYLLVPSADLLGSTTFPAPAARSWALTAELMTSGLEVLSTTARWAVAVGVVVAVALTFFERRFGIRSWWMPSSFGLGMGMIIGAGDSFALLLGALVALAVRRTRADKAGLITPVSSGLIAGESLMGLLVAALLALGMMPD